MLPQDKSQALPTAPFRLGLPLSAGVLVILLTVSGTAGPKDKTVSDTSSDNVLFSDATIHGMLFVDGKFIEAPYAVTATSDAVRVNGTVLNYTAIESEYDDLLEDRFRRRNESARADGRRRPRQTQPPAVRIARELSEALIDRNIVVSFAGFPCQILSGGNQEYLFFDALLAEQPTAEQTADFGSLAGNAAAEPVWQEWLQSFHPAGQLRNDMAQRLQALVQIETQNTQKIAALARLDRFAYPLTLVAMMLGVIALGHMLKWTARSLVTDQGPNCSPESVRCAELALLLMLGMSAIDLLWTILAGQAGIMKEVNPLAAGLITSPASLAMFKVTATAVGCGILFAFRTRKRVQDATWWMCLICVLVTFRWVMFDSLNT